MPPLRLHQLRLALLLVVFLLPVLSACQGSGPADPTPTLPPTAALPTATAVLAVVTATSPGEAAAPPIPLADAQADGAIQFSGRGAGLIHLNATFVNTLDRPLRVLVPAGTLLAPESSKTQLMLVRFDTTVELAPRATVEADLPVACAEMHKYAPGPDDLFSFDPRFKPHADMHRLLAAPTFAEINTGLQQLAIWTITDNPCNPTDYTLFSSVSGAQLTPDVNEVRALFENAGIPLDKYCLFNAAEFSAEGIRTVKISPNGRLIAMLLANNTFEMLDLPALNSLWISPPAPGTITDFAFDPDSAALTIFIQPDNTGQGPITVARWSAADGKPQPSPVLPENTAFAYFPADLPPALIGDTLTDRLAAWDPASNALTPIEIGTFRNTYDSTAAAGRYYLTRTAASGAGFELQAYDLASGKPLNAFHIGNATPTYLEASADGGALAVYIDTGLAPERLVFYSPDGTQIAALDLPNLERPRFSPDGRYLAALSPSIDGRALQIAVVDVATGSVRLTPIPAGARLHAWLPDASALVLARPGKRLILLLTAGLLPAP